MLYVHSGFLGLGVSVWFGFVFIFIYTLQMRGEVESVSGIPFFFLGLAFLTFGLGGFFSYSLLVLVDLVPLSFFTCIAHLRLVCLLRIFGIEEVNLIIPTLNEWVLLIHAWGADRIWYRYCGTEP